MYIHIYIYTYIHVTEEYRCSKDWGNSQRKRERDVCVHTHTNTHTHGHTHTHTHTHTDTHTRTHTRRGESGQLGLGEFKHSGVPTVIKSLDSRHLEGKFKMSVKQVECGAGYSAVLMDR